VTYIALLIPFVGMALGGFVFYAVSHQARVEREMLHRERLAAIEKGLDVPLFDIKEPKNRTSPLRSALVTLALGLGLWLPVLQYGPECGCGVRARADRPRPARALVPRRKAPIRPGAEARRGLRRAYIERLRSFGRPELASVSKAD
jgi:hypothetical protein